MDFAPPINEMKVDLEEGTLEFTARAGVYINQEQLKKAIEDAGYKVEGIEVTDAGNKEGEP